MLLNLYILLIMMTVQAKFHAFQRRALSEGNGQSKSNPSLTKKSRQVSDMLNDVKYFDNIQEFPNASTAAVARNPQPSTNAVPADVTTSFGYGEMRDMLKKLLTQLDKMDDNRRMDQMGDHPNTIVPVATPVPQLAGSRGEGDEAQVHPTQRYQEENIEYGQESKRESSEALSSTTDYNGNTHLDDIDNSRVQSVEEGRTEEERGREEPVTARDNFMPEATRGPGTKVEQGRKEGETVKRINAPAIPLRESSDVKKIGEVKRGNQNNYEGEKSRDSARHATTLSEKDAPVEYASDHPGGDAARYNEGSDSSHKFLGMFKKEKNKKRQKIIEKRSKWTDWTEWSTCSVTCGKGRQIRWRHCQEQCDDIETEMEEKACQLPACGKLFGVINL